MRKHLAAWVVIVSVTTGCGGWFHVKADTVCIIDANGKARCKGKFWVKLDNSGKPLWDSVDPLESCNLFFFRAALAVPGTGFQARGGTIYKVQEGRKLVEVGSFDTTLTDEQLFSYYLAPEKK